MSLHGHSKGLGFRKFQFPLPQSNLPTAHTFKQSIVIPVITTNVSDWYDGKLYVGAEDVRRLSLLCLRFSYSVQL